MSFAPTIEIVQTTPVKDIGNIGHVYVASINAYKNRLQMNSYRRPARIRTIRFLRRLVTNKKISQYKHRHRNYKKTGGEQYEAFYDTQSCTLQQRLQSLVPGKTLNCPYIPLIHLNPYPFMYQHYKIRPKLSVSNSDRIINNLYFRLQIILIFLLRILHKK